MRAKLTTPWILALIGSAAGVVFLIGLPSKQDAPLPILVEPPLEAPAARPPVDPSMLEQVNNLLAPPESSREPDAERLAQKVFALGPGALDVIVALVCGDAEGREVAAGTLDVPVHPRAIEAREEILASAFARFRADARVQAIATRASGASVDTRLAVLPLLASVHDRGALRATVALTSDLDPIQWQRQYVSGAIERALAEQLTRAPEFVRDLEQNARGMDPVYAAILVRAAASVRTSATLSYVVDRLGRDEALDRDVLASIAKMAAGGRMPVPSDTWLLVERYTTNADPAVRRAAVEALGALGEADSFGALLDRLDDSEPFVAHAARRALQALAGVDRGPQREAWEDWSASEENWREQEFNSLVERLSSDSPGAVLRAMTTLVSHPLVRHEAAEAIAPLALSDDPAVSEAASGALGVLGSARAIPSLIEALDAADEVQRDSACAALRRLTGLELPAESERWRVAVAR